MTPLETAVRIVVDLLVRREYVTLERMTRGQRLTAADLQHAVAEYDATLTVPGDEWWGMVGVMPIDGTDPPEYSVVAPLWTQEEGRSDLSLELTLVETIPGVYEIEVDNLHVL